MGANPKKNTPPPKQNNFRGNAASTVIMCNKWREAAKNFAAPPLAPPPLGPPETPLHHWKLDEAAGADEAADTGTSATKVTLTLVGNNAEFLGLGAGGGVALPNTTYADNNFLDMLLGNTLTLPAKDGFTFMVWVRYYADHGDAAERKILYLSQNGGNYEFQLSSYAQARGGCGAWCDKLLLLLLLTDKGGTGPSSIIHAVDPLDRPPGQWSHVAWTVTANGAWSLYRDGETQGDWHWPVETTGGTGTGTVPITFNEFTLGDRLNGDLRDARLYDRALSAAEIKHIFDYTKRG